MASFPSSDCFAEPQPLKPYPDIGGPGVLVGFLGNAWIVVTLVVLHYFLAFDPAKDPFQRPEKPGLEKDEDSHTWRPNYVDRVAIKWFRRFSGFAGRPRLETAFTQVLLGMCDVQLLTGTGILFSAYFDLAFRFISAYHWQLVLIKWSSDFVQRNVRQRSSRAFRELISWLNARYKPEKRGYALDVLLIKPMMALYLSAKLYADLITSNGSDRLHQPRQPTPP
ncbi:hypothetical protein B0T19DRAFT_469802 [Cercophora scortea]|uniref:Uncharacterized protein n=1 Tax=Cercophora scortea TaxID=314031 RepID=A0AAE0M3A6_9PEZI|nr:hypothetical protein B0T19DRAFT_469802 [Cercophora scortea]